MAEDILGLLNTTAGIAPDGEVTRLRPEARLMLQNASKEIQHLRKVVREYGERGRMSNCSDAQLQEVIDRAFSRRY